MPKPWKILLGVGLGIILLFVSYLLVREIRTSSARKEEPNPLELLAFVPSDAAYVACFEKASTGIALVLDSNSVYRRLDFANLASANMVLSYNYAAQLVPILGIDVSSGDPSVLRNSAENVGLKTYSVSCGSRNIMLISPSVSMIDQVRSHLNSGTSILDAPMFNEALSRASRNTVIIRNSAAHRLLPKNLALLKYFSRRDVAGFLKQLSEWMVFNLEENGIFSMASVASDSPAYYCRTFSCGGVSKLSEMLPNKLEYVVDFCFEDWKSRLSLINAYRDAYNSLSISKSDERVASGLKIEEIAKIVFEGRELLLVRPASMQSGIPDWNPGLLFGNIFSIPETTCGVVYKGWILYGSQKTIDEYILGLRSRLYGWPEDEVSAVFYCNDIGLVSVRSDNIKCVWNQNR